MDNCQMIRFPESRESGTALINNTQQLNANPGIVYERKIKICERKRIGFGFKCSKPINKDNILVALTFVGVVLGVAIGLGVRTLKPSETTKTLLTFPGEIFMRMLKMLIIPVIVTSIATALSSMDVRNSGRMGLHAITYYLVTTTIAVIIGIILVTAIHPGHPNADVRADFQPVGTVSTLDSFLDLTRNLFPENIIAACFQVVRTHVSQLQIVNQTISTFVNATNVTMPSPIFKETSTEKNLEYIDGTNVLGLIVFFSFFGVTLSQIGEEARPFVRILSILNNAFMRMMMIVIWSSPIGICSLIAKNFLQLKDVSEMIQTLGMYIITVCSGLLIHGLVVYSVILFAITRRNPLKFYAAVVQALLGAVGTASTAAVLPISMKCLERKCNVDKRVTQFVLPLGATINMDGTALLEGVASITIAQMYGVPLTFANIVTISVTATLASIGAATVPGSGLVMLVLVLTAVGLPPDAVGILWSVDWFLDRIRTVLNVLGDCVGAAVVHHLNKEFLDRQLADDSQYDSNGNEEIVKKEGELMQSGNGIVDSGLSMVANDGLESPN